MSDAILGGDMNQELKDVFRRWEKRMVDQETLSEYRIDACEQAFYAGYLHGQNSLEMRLDCELLTPGDQMIKDAWERGAQVAQRCQKERANRAALALFDQPVAPKETK